ncbi:MAG: hypothetical protein UV42_C0060G0005 [Candidatus Magasanikbacteria bacterium GW2011_GWE2_42_7]|uniref:Uncharacterized protein n=1 Tax=Candidatus Magasanikbacteria bacterium GW2011_GWE2_42_7 TaxID=1619052 RepID=A0A0G1BAM4_9BACT|nr:MAG: hypothetical protein UV42_C0060G0005 [Candidatus Magasanikbacteria bacterium GW2011_GWE2_42_7]
MVLEYGLDLFYMAFEERVFRRYQVFFERRDEIRHVTVVFNYISERRRGAGPFAQLVFDLLRAFRGKFDFSVGGRGF